MRSGVSASQVRGGLVWSARVESWRGGALQCRGGETSARVISGTLSESVDQGVLSELTVVLEPQWAPSKPLDPFNKYGQRARLLVAAGDHELDFGMYVIQKAQVQSDGSVEVTANGLLQLLEDDPFPLATSPKKGTRLSQELQRLCGDHLQVKLDPGVVDEVVPSGLSWGSSRTEAVTNLCAAMGVIPRIPADGRLHVGPAGEATPLDTMRYTDLLLGESEDAGGRAANVVTVTGKGTVPAGWELKTLVSQDYGKTNSRAGWTSSDTLLAFRYPDTGGVSNGGYLQVLWNQPKPKEDQPEPAPISGVVAYTKTLPAAGEKVITLQVRSSTSAAINIEVYSGTKLLFTQPCGDCTSWTPVTLNIQSGQKFTKFRIVQSGTFARGHWIGIDQFKITSNTQKTKEIDLYGSARESNVPYEQSGYGTVRTVTSSDSAKSVASASKIASGLLAEGLTSARVVSLTCAPDPRWELGDPLAADLERGGMTAGRARAVELDLTGQSDMRIDVGVFK